MFNKLVMHIGSLIFKRPLTVLLFLLAVTLVLGFAATKLKLKSSIVDLLPDNFKSVQDLNDFQREFGGTAYLTILVEHNSRDEAIKFVRDFAREVERLPDVMYVDYEKPVEFFNNKSLWFVSLEDLEEIDRRILNFVKQERKGKSPVWSKLLNFTDEPEPLEFSDIEQKYTGWVRKDFARFLEGRYYESRDKNIIALLVKPKQGSLDMEDNRKLVGKIREVEERLSPTSYHESLKVGYTGEYQTALDHNKYLSYEIAKVLSVVFVILVLLVFIYYRRITSIFLVGFPMIASLLWSAGATALILGHVNMVTSYCAGVLLGLGSDYAIYILSRYFQERRRGLGIEKAYDLAFCKTGRATVGACLTTVAAFLVLLFSGFKVFVEFGLIGVMGILFAYLAVFTIMPALIVIFERRGLFEMEEKWLGHHSVLKQVPRRFPFCWGTVGVVLVFIVLFLWNGRSVFTIEYDLKKMEDYKYRIASFELGKKADKVFHYALRPAVIVVKDRNEEKEIVRELRRRSDENPALFRQVVALSQFVPTDQELKKQKVKDINEHWQMISMDSIRKKYEGQFELLDGFVDERNLPVELKRLFISPKSGSSNSLVYVVSGVDRSNIDNVRKFGESVRDIRLANNRVVSASGDWMIVYDILTHLNQITFKVCTFAFILIIFILFLDIRRFGDCITISLSFLISMLLFAAFMVVFRLRFNILNVAIIPVIMGTGIDSFAHFYYRYREDGDGIVKPWNEMFAPVLMANLTTLIGFGGFILSANAGLRSIGWVAVVGITSVFITSLFFYPAILQLVSSVKYQPKIVTEFPPTNQSSEANL